RAAMTSSLLMMTAGESHRSAALTASQSAKDEKIKLIARMHPGIRPPQLQPLPARLGDAGNQSARRQLAKSQPRNLEPPDKCPSPAGNLATINHPHRTCVARQLREAGIVLLCFQLRPQRGIFLDRRALAFVAVDPGCFRHKGTRKVAEKPPEANRFPGVPALPAQSKDVPFASK